VFRRTTFASVGSMALLLGCLVVARSGNATEATQADYMLGCQGCHLADGRGFPAHGVPKLTGYMGNFLKVYGGREFLVQVPGSAQSNLSDARLAALLNWMLLTFSPNELPADFAPYSAAEVARLRTRPLVSVTDTRAGLVRQIGAVAAVH
jgi:cytochrome c553